MTGESLIWVNMTPSQRWAPNARDKCEFAAGAFTQVAAPFGGAFAGIVYGRTGGAIAMACRGVALIA